MVAGGWGKRKGSCLMSIVLILQDENNSGDWLCNNVNVLNTNGLYI